MVFFANNPILKHFNHISIPETPEGFFILYPWFFPIYGFFIMCWLLLFFICCCIFSILFSFNTNIYFFKQVWKNYVCEVSAGGICTTPGRLTPKFYNQMSIAVNVSTALHHYGPFLVDLQDCSFVRNTFTDITGDYCPGLRLYSEWIFIGLTLVSSAVLLSLIIWMLYTRPRNGKEYIRRYADMPSRDSLELPKGMQK